MRPANGLILFLLIILFILTPVIIIKRWAPINQKPCPLSRIPITLYSRQEGRIYHTDLENYLIGVVAAEMPVNFSLEALKAQAVAARTIAVSRLKRYGGRGCQHYSGADFCDDPSENQAWLSISELKVKWGNVNFKNYYNKIYQAVWETAGIIMVYNNKPIDAVFHSTCGVGTADANEIWHHWVPYLRSVDCGFDQSSPRYTNELALSWAQLASRLHIPFHSLKTIHIRKRSFRGRVLSVSIGSNQLSGENFRRSLNLTSTCFTWVPSKNGLIFKTIGYGHGVGMCQYGANGMAQRGYSFKQILCHYYQGIIFGMIKE